jgi:hypothetical protein
MDPVPEGSSDAEVRFKRIPSGFVFRAPRPWPFMPAPHFLASEHDKARIMSVLRRTPRQKTAILALMAIAWLFAFPLAAWSYRIAIDIWLGLFAAGAAAFFLYDWWRLRPVIAGLPATAERITLIERMNTRAAITSLGWLVVWDVLFSYWLLCAGMDCYATLTPPHRSGDLWMWPQAIALAGAWIYMLTITVLKVRLATRSDRAPGA